MIIKFVERKEREANAITEVVRPISKPVNQDRQVSDEDLFRQLGDKIRVVKKPVAQ